MAINFDALPTDKPAGSSFVVPKGRYLATIDKAEMKQGKDTAKPEYLNLTLELVNPEDKTPVGKVWDIITESTADLAQYKLKRLIIALGLPIKGDFDLKDLAKMVVGKKMLVDIKIDEKASPERSVVDATAAEIYYPLTAPNTEVPATPVLSDVVDY